MLNLSQPNANAGGLADPNNKHKKSKNYIEGEVIVQDEGEYESS